MGHANLAETEGAAPLHVIDVDVAAAAVVAFVAAVVVVTAVV